MNYNEQQERKKIIILKFLTRNPDNDFSQGDISRKLHKTLNYSTSGSARACVGRLLMKLKAEGHADYIKKRAKMGTILKHVWYVK